MSFQSEIREPQEIDGKDSSAGIPKSSSRSSRASQPSLRVFMNAMSDVATKVSITMYDYDTYKQLFLHLCV